MAKWNQRSEADRYNARVSNVFTSRGNLTDLAGYFFSGYGPVSFMVGGGSAAERYAPLMRFLQEVIGRMPVIVLLMILYYVILGKVSISGMWVSVIGFTLVFAASVYSMILSGVKAVDYGQTEASYALGFTDRETFFGIILPQAAQHFMPMYKAEIVSLIKATAVVGYIAVQDLTKMGDIIRSRTYEAFFPLIAVAVIYFIISAILTWIVSRITVSVDPEKRSVSEILKGVKTDD